MCRFRVHVFVCVLCVTAQSDAMIRWTAVAIRGWNLTTFTPLNDDPNSPPIGYWLMGNILNCAGMYYMSYNLIVALVLKTSIYR